MYRPSHPRRAAHRPGQLARSRGHLWAAGGVALGLGVAVYAWGRPALQGSPNAAWLGPLPSALHSLAFTLWLTLACARTRASVAALAGGWALLNLLIETAQHPAVFALLPVAFTRHWHGQFDPLDLSATALSAAAAAALVARSLPCHALSEESTAP